MFNINELIKDYVPDNHWLSKSMEVGKIKYGTYWYLKKMMVYYYYIFILKKMNTKEIQEIRDIFNEYIRSLPCEVQEEATNFFFEIDIRDTSKIITLQRFSITYDIFENEQVEKIEKLNARKYYYTYIMNHIGQNHNKALIMRETIEAQNYFEGLKNAKKLISSKEVNELARDVHAFLRNERQILFIMGLLNYTKILNVEEYIPTSMGNYAVYANYNELI